MDSDEEDIQMPVRELKLDAQMLSFDRNDEQNMFDRPDMEDLQTPAPTNGKRHFDPDSACNL